MATSEERPVIAKRINVEDVEQLRMWINNVALWIQSANEQGLDLKGNVVNGEIFLNDLPTNGSGTTDTLWNDSGTIKIVL